MPELFSDPLVAFAFGSTLGFIIGLAAWRLHAAGRRELQNQGESAVRRELSSAFPGAGYYLFNDVTLPYQDGTTQIDHVLVARTGIFVIETKHYSGWIFGDEASRSWTQVIFRVKNRFQNPLHQNAKHARAIRELLDFVSPEDIHPIVVFTGDGEFKTPRPAGVLHLEEIVDHICSFAVEVMSPNRMDFCVGRIETRRRLISRRTDIEHHAYLQRKYGRLQ